MIVLKLCDIFYFNSVLYVQIKLVINYCCDILLHFISLVYIQIDIFFLRNTDISLCDFLLHKNLKNIFCPNTPCGIIDTVKFLLNNYDCDNHSLLQMLLKSY